MPLHRHPIDVNVSLEIRQSRPFQKSKASLATRIALQATLCWIQKMSTRTISTAPLQSTSRRPLKQFKTPQDYSLPKINSASRSTCSGCVNKKRKRRRRQWQLIRAQTRSPMWSTHRPITTTSSSTGLSTHPNLLQSSPSRTLHLLQSCPPLRPSGSRSLYPQRRARCPRFSSLEAPRRAYKGSRSSTKKRS